VSGFFCTPNGRCRTILPEVAQEAYAAALAKDLADCPLPEGAYSDDPSAYEAPHHFVCFARSDKDGCLYVLNGSNNGPIATKLGPVDAGEGGDILGADTMALIRSHIARVSFWGHEEDFHLLGLVDRGSGNSDGKVSAAENLASEEK
jgi:hypothetical protein